MAMPFLIVYFLGGLKGKRIVNQNHLKKTQPYGHMFNAWPAGEWPRRGRPQESVASEVVIALRRPHSEPRAAGFLAVFSSPFWASTT